MRATEGEGTAERGRCRHCGESVILVTFMNYPDTWFHTNTRFPGELMTGNRGGWAKARGGQREQACRGGKTEAEVASS